MGKRSQVVPLIRELQEACRRPLFTEIWLDDSKQHYGVTISSHNKKIGDDSSPSKTTMVVPPETGSSHPPLTTSSSPATAKVGDMKQQTKISWRELAIQATQLLPFMTEKEHGEISHLMSILLLGFLLPHSTGNEYFLMQHTPSSNKNTWKRGGTREEEEEEVQSTSDLPPPKQQPQTNATTNTNNRTNNISEHHRDALDYILHMDLDERLESSCRHHSAMEFGEFDTLTDSNWELALDSFLNEGLAPYLGSRPAHLQSVDLIHILAMCIHPQPSAETSIPDTVTSLDDKYYWRMTRNKLMKNRHAHSLHVNYGHRLKIINLIVQHLVIPAYDPDSPIMNCALFDGAIPHLRSSLHSFAIGTAVSMKDAHLARSALVTVAIQCRIEVAMKEEWEFLINRMVDDRTRYPGCKYGCPRMLQQGKTAMMTQAKGKDSSTNNSNNNDDGRGDASFCPHAGRGQHLADFLIRSCQARRYADNNFLNEAFSSLTDAIEWQTHCWKQPDDTEPTDSEETPSMLASLLFAAKSFFYFLLPVDDTMQGRDKQQQQQQQDDNLSDVMMRRDELVSCAIQLCHHFDPNIASQAAELVALAFAYGSKKTIEESAQPLCLSLRIAIATLAQKEPGKSDIAKLESQILQSSLQSAICAASRRSPSFAFSFLNMLLEQGEFITETVDAVVDKDGDVSMKDATDNGVGAKSSRGYFLLELIASISISNPVVAGQKADALDQLLKKLKNEPSRSQVIAAIMATRQSRFFVPGKDPGEAAVVSATSQISDRWNLYQLGRLALATGNFAAASQCYKQILSARLSERYFVWLSALVKVSDSEVSLTKHAARGIPEATTTMRGALSMLLSLNALDRSQDSDFSFQISCVRLRLDFLDLLTGLRQLIREMRLTGNGPAKRTRSFLHFQNITRCFDALARRYWSVYRTYGLFSCQQTRTSLRTLYVLCRFVARVVRIVFSDAHLANKKEEKRYPNEPTGDTACPVSRFMERLEEGLLHKMSPAVDPVIRAAAMLEVVDGILLCPVPFPMGFLTVSSLPSGTLRLTVDPEQATNDTNRIDCYPGLSFEFYAHGEIPESVLAQSRLPFTAVLLWHRADYVGPLQDYEHLEKQEDEHMADEKQEEDPAGATPPKVIPRPWNYTLVSTNLHRNGRFCAKVECPTIREEGNYVIEVKLGCRDIRGGEWEIPTRMEAEDAGKLDVQVSRSV